MQSDSTSTVNVVSLQLAEWYIVHVKHDRFVSIFCYNNYGVSPRTCEQTIAKATRVVDFGQIRVHCNKTHIIIQNLAQRR